MTDDGRVRQPGALLAVLPALLALLLPALLLSGLAPGAARAQDDDAAPLDPVAVDALADTAFGVRMVDIDGVVGGASDRPLELTLDLAAGRLDRADLRVVVTLFARVTSASSLEAALAGNSRNPFATVDLEVGDLDAGLERRVQLQASPEELSLDAEDVEGVYPLEVQVFAGADAVGELATAIVVDPHPRRAPMPTSVVLSLPTPAVPGPDATATPELRDALVADGPLIRATRDLERITGSGSAAGLVLALDAQLISQLDAIAGPAPADDPTAAPDATPAGTPLTTPAGEGPVDVRLAPRAERVRTALTTTGRRADVQVVGLPLARPDLPALVRGGLADEAVALVAQGRDEVARLMGVDPTPEVLGTTVDIDADTVAALSVLRPELHLLPQRNLVVPTRNAQMQPVRRVPTEDGGELTMLRADASLGQLLEDRDDRGVAAVTQELLARTALRWMEGSQVAGQTTSQADRTAGVLIHLADPAAVPEEMVPAVLQLASRTPWLRPVNLTRMAELVSTSRADAALSFPSRRIAEELDPEYVAQLARAHQALAPLSAMLPEDDPTTATLRDTLDLAASAAHRDADARAAGLERIARTLELADAIADGIEVFPGPPLTTLTSTTGQVPVLLRSSLDIPLRVRLRATSTRFAIDEPVRDVLLEPQGSQLVALDVEALTPGALAGINVVVQDPTGTIQLERTRIAVRSTAFPVVALIAVVGGGLLLLWWGLRQGRRRRVVGPDRADDELAA